MNYCCESRDDEFVYYIILYYDDGGRVLVYYGDFGFMIVKKIE